VVIKRMNKGLAKPYPGTKPVDRIKKGMPFTGSPERTKNPKPKRKR
jgi:hypothetical protein